MIALVAASTAFVGTHFLLSHPLRRSLVGTLGKTGFLGVYALAAAATLGWLAMAYRATPPTALLWPPGDGVWLFASVFTLVASVLLVGSLFGNPALPGPAAQPGAARGVFAVTRHPMMWGFALWGFAHIAAYPEARNLTVATAIIVLALVGAALQDRKKAALQPGWSEWQARTSWLPFAAIADRRVPLRAMWPGWRATLGGVGFWLIATYAHVHAIGIAAGPWRWIG